MPRGWRELESLPRGARLLDDFGEVVSRWRAALDAGAELPATWVLDTKHFRRGLEILPPGHRPGEILADRSAPRRAAKAARAFERLAAAAEELALPDLPPATKSVVLWSSLVVRPRGVELPALTERSQLEPDADAVRRAIARIWASVYLEQSLREMLAAGVKRIEVVVGLTALPQSVSAPRAPASSSELPDVNAQSWTALLTEDEPAPTGFPWPGSSRDCGPTTALGRSLGAESARAWRGRLRERWGRSGAAVVQQGSGRWQWQAEPALRLLERAGRTERSALAALIGLAPEESPEGGRLRPTVGARWVGELLRHGALLEGVRVHEARSDDALTGLAELDLAVLPDDGLKRTLEDASGLLRQTEELLVDATLSAELLIAGCERLAPECALLVDAGLEALPWCGLLTDWEERLAVVRNDAACRAALVGASGEDGWSELPEGPGQRALEGWIASHGFLARQPLEPACPRLHECFDDLLELVRLSLERPLDVSARCRESRFAADRAVAEAERERGRLFALSFGALRGFAADAVLLRERLRLLEFRMGALLRRIALDVDRRLRRLEPGLPVGAAFDCTSDELLEVVDLRGSSLEARVAWRRAGLSRQRRRPEPWYPAARRGGEAEEARSSGGVALSRGQTEGSVTTELLDGLWLVRMGYVPGVRVRWASRSDSAAVLARALGVPLVCTLGAGERC